MSDNNERRGHNVALFSGSIAPIIIALIGQLSATPSVGPLLEPVPAAAAAPAPAPAPPPQTPTGAASAATSPAAATPTPAAVTGTPPPFSAVLGDPGADVTKCVARFGNLRLPYQRGDDAAAEQVRVCRNGYILSFNRETCNPDWVLERLSPADLVGPAKRSDKFGTDPLINTCLTALADYRGSGYDRGHQAPAGDAKSSQATMDQSFRMSNMAPQVGIGFNRGAWKYLEETVRAWVLCGGHTDLYVVTGPLYGGSQKTIGAGKVLVPAAFFKIVYDPVENRAVGFVLPNSKIGSRIDNLQDYVKPIEYIETETGLNFFANLPNTQQVALEENPGVAWGHIGSCSGAGND